MTPLVSSDKHDATDVDLIGMHASADMAKYAEVKEKQRNVDQVREKDEPFNRGVWVGFTYKPRKAVQDEAEVRLQQCTLIAADLFAWH